MFASSTVCPRMSTLLMLPGGSSEAMHATTLTNQITVINMASPDIHRFLIEEER